MTAKLEEEVLTEDLRRAYGEAVARMVVADHTVADIAEGWETAVLECGHTVARTGMVAGTLIINLAASLRLRDTERAAAEYVALKLAMDRLAAISELIDKTLYGDDARK